MDNRFPWQDTIESSLFKAIIKDLSRAWYDMFLFLAKARDWNKSECSIISHFHPVWSILESPLCSFSTIAILAARNNAKQSSDDNTGLLPTPQIQERWLNMLNEQIANVDPCATHNRLEQPKYIPWIVNIQLCPQPNHHVSHYPLVIWYSYG